jgi:predicted Zn-ribbon and HTH transcriptional regulator
MISDNQFTNALTANEAEVYIQELKKIPIEEYGYDKWMKQHEFIEKLNIQAHLNVAQQSEEFISELLVTYDKIEALIYDLLVSETWRRKVFPLIKSKITQGNSLRVYLMLYHEVTIVNLLELVLYNKNACTSVDEKMLDLVDYCARKVTFLNTWEDDDDEDDESINDINKFMERSEAEQMEKTVKKQNYAISINALSILRYMTDYITDLPLSVMTRLLNTKDMITALSYLIESVPWVRRTPSNKILRWEGSNWKEISKNDISKLCQVEAQIWIALYNLMVEPECRRKYAYTNHTREVILRLRPYLTSQLIDELPILTDLKRVLDELSILNIPDNSVQAGLLVEQIPEMLEEIKNGKDWKKIAKKCKKEILNDSQTNRMELAKKLAGMYNIDQFDPLIETPKCAKCGKPADKRCSKCKNEWYCSRECQVRSWPAHKKICSLVTSINDDKLKQENKSKITVLN